MVCIIHCGVWGSGATFGGYLSCWCASHSSSKRSTSTSLWLLAKTHLNLLPNEHSKCFFATSFAKQCNNRIKIFSGERGQSYPKWEDHFIYVLSAFEMPDNFWALLATTYLHDHAMKHEKGTVLNSTVLRCLIPCHGMISVRPYTCTLGIQPITCKRCVNFSCT